MPYLIKLKNILRFNIYIILVVIVTFFYVIYVLNKELDIPSDNIEVTGIIDNIYYDVSKLQITLKGKEIVLVNKYDEIEKLKNSIKIGYKVRIKGQVNIPRENTNFNIFNYRKYLLSKKITYTVTADDIQIISSKQNMFYIIKEKIQNLLLSNDVYPYLYAFILGDSSYISENVKDSYLSNGISHLLSVSGMHVGFLSSTILFLLNKVSKKENINHVILFLILLFYTFLCGFTPSIMRSVIFTIIIYVKKKLNISISTFKLFIIMTSIFLIYNPYFVYSVGFLYSFTISGFLIYFSNLLKNKNYWGKLLIVSILAFLVSFPISLYNNFEINLFSPLLNLLFVPLVTFVIFPMAFLTIIFSFLTPIYALLISVLENISLFCTNNFSLHIVFGKPNLIVIIIYYFLVFSILKNLKKKRGYIVLILLLVIQYNNKFFLNFTRVTMLDVGQGDSILIELSNNKGNILLDTGGIVGNDYSLVGTSTISYLKSLGIKKLDYLILSHGDYDHAGEAINLVNNFKVDKVIFNCGEFNNLEQDLIKVLEKKKIKYHSCIKELNIGSDTLYFLNNNDYGNENANSSVIYTELNHHKFLFMGDAGVEVEKDILQKYKLKDIDVLKVGHHGSKTSSNKDFINEINPKYAIISVGINNRYGHPNVSVLDNLDSSTIYRTDLNGSIMFKVKSNKLEIETCES